MIQVKSNVADHTVAFWERDRRHPGGEIFIDRVDTVYEVGETPGIKRAIKRGQLVKVYEGQSPFLADEPEPEPVEVPEHLIDQGDQGGGPSAPVTDLVGIGPATAGKLFAVGIKTMGDLAAVEADEIADLADDLGMSEDMIAGWIAKAQEA